MVTDEGITAMELTHFAVEDNRFSTKGSGIATKQQELQYQGTTEHCKRGASQPHRRKPSTPRCCRLLSRTWSATGDDPHRETV